MESVKISRLTNGFVIEGSTSKVPDSATYCSNLRGVVAELYRAFEGTTKMNREQLDFLKGISPQTVKTTKK